MFYIQYITSKHLFIDPSKKKSLLYFNLPLNHFHHIEVKLLIHIRQQSFLTKIREDFTDYKYIFFFWFCFYLYYTFMIFIIFFIKVNVI